MRVNDHDYVFSPLPYDTAIEVAAELGGALLPSLGALLDGPLGSAMAGDIAVKDLLDTGLQHVMRDVNPSEVGRVMGESLRRGDLTPGMLRKALSTTTRDGVTLQGTAFDDAFRGAATESFLAAFHAMAANGLFTWPSTSGQ